MRPAANAPFFPALSPFLLLFPLSFPFNNCGLPAAWRNTIAQIRLSVPSHSASEFSSQVRAKLRALMCYSFLENTQLSPYLTQKPCSLLLRPLSPPPIPSSWISIKCNGNSRRDERKQPAALLEFQIEEGLSCVFSADKWH